MKFLTEEYQSITQLLKKNEYSEDQFYFQKKKGSLHITINKRKDSFCFYRKTETKLNSNMKFEDSTYYLIGVKKNIRLDNWVAVLSAIEKWL